MLHRQTYKGHYILFIILCIMPMVAYAGILDTLESIWQFFANFWNEFTNFFYTMIIKVIAWFVIVGIKFTIIMLYLSWEVAKEIISMLGITQAINDAFSNLNSRLLEIILYFDVPDHLNAILSSMMTRFVYSKLT